MKMPESIIKKLKLFPSGEQCGESFKNNLIVYKSQLPILINNRVMECDLKGKDCNYVTIFNVIDQKAFQTTIEYLESADIELVLASMIE
jgi:hypothetical protein